MKFNNPSPALETEMSRSNGESVNLDVLRSIAVLLVFGNHYFELLLHTSKGWTPLGHFGQLGVLIFFVHTCLVLMWSLERSNHRGPHLFVPFYVRRAMRIYPLSIFCVLAAYIFDAQWSFDAQWTQANLWQNLTLTQYVHFKGTPLFPPFLGALWTLPLEVGMYLVLPLLFLIFRNRSILLLGLMWFITIPMAWFQPRLGEGFAFFRYVPCFLGGVIAWRLMRKHNRQRFPGSMWPFAIAAVSLLWMFSNAKDMAFCIAAFGLCLGVAIPFFREIRSPKIGTAAKLVARYSYGIYLSHFPIMVYIMSPYYPGHPAFKFIPPMPVIRHFARPIHAILIVAFTAGASYLLYHGIEKPGIELGRRLANRLTHAGAPRDRNNLVETVDQTTSASVDIMS
jgi:peptidoglycan/LPS O-acetylase OafA/YrhL